MFAIYLPGRHPNTDAAIRDVGAGWALDPSVTAMFLDVPESGPDGGGGKLVYFDGRRGRFPNQITRIDLQTQTWLPAAKDGEAAEGRYWIGVVTGAALSPEWFQREAVIDGPPVKLLDGNHWVVPIAEYLPKRLTINRSTGEQETRPFDIHLPFVEQTNAMFRHLIGEEFQRQVQEELSVVIPNGLVYASTALGKNYRVNHDLVDALGLIGELEAVRIAAVATGLESLASISLDAEADLLSTPSVAALRN